MRNCALVVAALVVALAATASAGTVSYVPITGDSDCNISSSKTYTHKFDFGTGGTAIDVTERVHPAVAARAIDAARSVGLDIAGIDMLAHDISRPLEEQGGAVVEVNAAPGLRMHLEPSAGIARPVGEARPDSNGA